MTFSAHSASVKAAILTGIALVLLIPLTLLESLVSERTGLRDAAVQSVARGWGDKQWISGPIRRAGRYGAPYFVVERTCSD